MDSKIPCPLCNYLTDPNARSCENCAIDLALAAVLAEHSYTKLPQIPNGIQLAPEVLVPRLGKYLVEKDVLQPSDLQLALDYQEEKVESGQPFLIGQALIDLGLIDRPTLDEAITEQILQLQAALHQANNQLEQHVRERTSDLQQALNKLTELSQLKSNFISNISHELRTPLTHIKGYLDMLSDGSLGPLTTRQQDALRVLQRAETRLEKLIEDLIQFSLAARGELSIQFSSFDICELIDISISQITNKAKESRVSIESSIPGNIPKVSADKEKIGWVLIQLIDNAVKFTPQGGHVKLEARDEDGLIIVSVSDTGIGIPPDRISEIFEPFHQLDGSITRQYPGTGLGLTMVHRILDAHGSPINVQSTVGKGSRFEFSLLIADNNHD